MLRPNIKLTIAATTLTILATPLLNVQPAKAVTITESPMPAYVSVEQEKDLLLVMREKQAERKLELEKEKAKQEAIRKEQDALEKARNNFYYIVKNKDLKQVDLRTASGLTVETANEILKGTGLEGLGAGFVNAEKHHGVNAYYLMAHAAWESEWGKSSLAVNKNNLFGFTAYDASPGSSATNFASKEECIDVVAGYVKDHYLSNKGQYHNGPNLVGMNTKYATDKEWATGIANVMTDLVDKSLDTL